MSPFSRARLILWVGVLVHIFGNFWDAWWHERNSGLESPSDLLQAHGFIYAGLLLIIAGSMGLFRQTWQVKGFSYRGFAIVLFGSVLELIGAVWDGIAHAGGADSAPAHSVMGIGILLVLTGLLVSVPAMRGDREVIES